MSSRVPTSGYHVYHAPSAERRTAERLYHTKVRAGRDQMQIFSASQAKNFVHKIHIGINNSRADKTGQLNFIGFGLLDHPSIPSHPLFHKQTKCTSYFTSRFSVSRGALGSCSPSRRCRHHSLYGETPLIFRWVVVCCA
eukprot:scaffold6066_cov161-Amphora_coffeaeformis.AAC.2